MKKFLLIFALASLSVAAQAQFEETKLVLGGGISYGANENSGTSGSGSVNTFGISPSIAKVIGSNSLIGAELSFGHSKSESSGNTYKTTAYSLGVYYQPFYPITEKIYFNWRGLAGFSNTLNTYESQLADSENSQFHLVFGLMPGLSWKVMDRLLLNATIGGASFDKLVYDSENNDLDNWSFNVNFNHPTFSFTYLLK